MDLINDFFAGKATVCGKITIPGTYGYEYRSSYDGYISSRGQLIYISVAC